MARRKRAQPKKPAETAADQASTEDAFLQSCLAEIRSAEARGISLVRKPPNLPTGAESSIGDNSAIDENKGGSKDIENEAKSSDGETGTDAVNSSGQSREGSSSNPADKSAEKNEKPTELNEKPTLKSSEGKSARAADPSGEKETERRTESSPSRPLVKSSENSPKRVESVSETSTRAATAGAETSEAPTSKVSEDEPTKGRPRAQLFEFGQPSSSNDEDQELLAQLSDLCTSEEMKILRESGAFGDVELQLTADGEASLHGRPWPLAAGPLPQYRPPPPPVPIYGDKPSTTSSAALGQELRYLATVMQPAEMRWLVSELAGDMLERSPVTHTDISDAVIASIAPSTAQKVAFMADAQYKYTTAQFLQVYLKMRHVVLEHKIMLASARADAMLLASSDLNIPDLLPEDMDTPVSAVSALRDIIDSEK